MKKKKKKKKKKKNNNILVLNQKVREKVSYCSGNNWLLRKRLEYSTHNSFDSNVVYGKGTINQIPQLQTIKVLTCIWVHDQNSEIFHLCKAVKKDFEVAQ